MVMCDLGDIYFHETCLYERPPRLLIEANPPRSISLIGINPYEYLRVDKGGPSDSSKEACLYWHRLNAAVLLPVKGVRLLKRVLTLLGSSNVYDDNFVQKCGVRCLKSSEAWITCTTCQY